MTNRPRLTRDDSLALRRTVSDYAARREQEGDASSSLGLVR
jgi:hypothetical protein